MRTSRTLSKKRLLLTENKLSTQNPSRFPTPSWHYHAVKALEDNYIWVLEHRPSLSTLVVDPSTHHNVIAMLDRAKLTCHAILITHHHYDHVGGNLELQKHYHCPIYGSRKDANRIPGITHLLSEGDMVSIGPWTFEVWEMDGHTHGHIAFYERAQQMIFSGDVLFSLGCGRFPQKDADKMHRSLSRFLHLDDKVQIFQAHEYTLQNTRFALSIEPEHVGLQKFLDTTKKLRARNFPTAPTTVAVERALNPFLRVHQHDFQRRLGFNPPVDPVQVLAYLREKKDRFT